MKRDGNYVLIYDIGDDKVRYQVAKTVEGYGIRVQRSAFECRLTRGMKERLWRALQEIALGEEDVIHLYSVGSGKIRYLGATAGQHPQAESNHAVIL
jgi:CRISPR-associated protein Cas2